MKKILFANHAQFERRHTNLGDWAIFEEMTDRFRDDVARHKVEIIVPSSDPAYTMTHYPVTAFQRGGIRGIINTLTWIAKSDVIVIGGGEIVQDKSSLVYIPYQLIRPLIGKMLGKKLFAYAIGIGEKEEISFIGKCQAKFVLNLFDIITVRDEKSYMVLKEYLQVKKPQMVLTADPALNLKAQSAATDIDQPFFVVSVRSVYHRNHNILPFSIRKKMGLLPKQYYSEIERFKTDIAKLADGLMDEYGYHVKFLNTYVGKSMSAADDKFTADIISRMEPSHIHNVSTIDLSLKPAEIKYLLGQSQFIITVPLHPLILGASENVPVFAIAYASKNKSFMKQIRHPEHIYPVESIGQKLNIGQIRKDIRDVMKNRTAYLNELNEIVTYHKKLEKKNFHLLKSLLKQI